MLKSKVLFILSGSIAAFKACAVISKLVQDGHEVRTVATPSALKFVGAATLEGLTGHPVLSDLWENGRAMDHIHLSRWADYGILCPASANTCARAAHGLADDLVGSLLLAWPSGKTLHIFPAMNIEMYRNPITRENLAKLSARGFVVHPTGDGNLACGEVGAGRLLEPDEIISLLPQSSQPREELGSVLITAGATREPIDGIRYLSNVSTGQTAATIADGLCNQGWRVTYLHGTGAQRPTLPVHQIEFGSFKDLDESLRQELAKQSYHAVIHAAAVSDYSIESVNAAEADARVKLKSEDRLELKLKPNHKILPRLKEYSREKNIKVIGFKLTLNQNAEKMADIGRSLLTESVDAIVANDWSRVVQDRQKHPGALLANNSTQEFSNLNELSKLIHAMIITGAR